MNHSIVRHLASSILVGATFVCPTIAQRANTITVAAGESPQKVIPHEMQFRYSEFRNGRAFFENGKASALLPFNYSFLTGEWQFIEKGDTVAVMGALLFPLVQVGDDQFFRDEKEGYLEVLAGNEKIKLTLQKRWAIDRKDMKVNDGYGEFTDATTGTRTTKYSSTLAKTIRNEDIVWKLEQNYWLMDEKNRIYRCTQGNFSRLFPEKRELIKPFVKKESIDFDRLEDLKKLLAYCLQH